MMVNRVISDNGLMVTEEGIDIDIRVPWYRALPLSTVGVTEIELDGKRVDLTTVGFEVNGKSFRLNELAAHAEEWWYVLDSAYLHVPGVNVVQETEHEVKVTVSIRPPYIPGFYRLTECTKRLRAH
jgi:hypothetical protein